MMTPAAFVATQREGLMAVITTIRPGPRPTELGGLADLIKSRSISADSMRTVTGVVTGSTASSYCYPTSGYLTGGIGGPNALRDITSGDCATDSNQTYSYNADGATTKLPGQGLTYDAEGHIASTQLTSGANSGSTQTNIYDANGELLLQTDPVSGSTAYIGDTILRVPAGSTTVSGSRTYTMFGGAIAERDATNGVSGSTLYFLDPNLNNTAESEMAASGSAVTHRYMDPFGNPRGAATPWSSVRGYLNSPQNMFTTGTGAGTTDPITLTGARSYDATTGRFLSVDPVLNPGSPQQSNGYSYASNNPVTSSDPTGLCPADKCGAGTPRGEVGGTGGSIDPVIVNGPTDPDSPGDLAGGTSLRVTPHISIDPTNPNAFAIEQGIWATEKALNSYPVPGYNYASGLSELYTWASYCNNAGSKVCGGDTAQMFTLLFNSWQSAGGQHPNLALNDMVVGYNSALASSAFSGGTLSFLALATSMAVVGIGRGGAPDEGAMANAAASGDTNAVVDDLVGDGIASEPSAADEGAGGLSAAYHYTGAQNVASIESNGLRAGAYATPNGALSPLQAHIDLALPPNRGLPGATLRIDLNGLRNAGYDIPSTNQVGRSFNMPGGGTEMQFPYPIPPQFIKVMP